MTVLRVALLQMASSHLDQEASLVKGSEFCRRAAEQGADIALFPEMWNVGYSIPEPSDPAAVEKWRDGAITSDGQYVAHFRQVSRDLGLAIAITFLERSPEGPRNTVCVIDRDGDVRLTYAKVHTCDFDREALLTPGREFPVCPVETGDDSVSVGAMICYDREFPESARLLMLAGAEIILIPNACDMERNRIDQLRARAFENMVGVALANYCPPTANGHSMAFDGIAFRADGSSRDMLVVEAGEAEAVYVAEFDLAELRLYRERETWGNAFRKPSTYGELVTGGVSPPFQRKGARR